MVHVRRPWALSPSWNGSMKNLLGNQRNPGQFRGGFEDMMVLNTHMNSKIPDQECTTAMTVLPEASANRHTYLGMNWDNVGWMRDSSCSSKWTG